MYKWPEEIPWEEYIRVYILEKTLRQLVTDQLSGVTDKWWRQRVPGDVWENAEERKREEEEKLVRTIDLHPIWYVDFLDYVKIITRDDNWSEVFGRVFKSKDDFKVMLQKLLPIRNKIAHTRPLNTREKKNLDALSEDVLVPIWTRVYNERYVKPSEKSMNEGKFLEAERILLEGFEKTGDPWIAYNIGRLYKETGRFIEARERFQYAEKYLPLLKYKELARKELLQTEDKIELARIRICPKCGSKVSRENLFCGKCGYKF